MSYSLTHEVLVIALRDDGLPSREVRNPLALGHRGAHEIRAVRPARVGAVGHVVLDVNRGLDEVDEVEEPHQPVVVRAQAVGVAPVWEVVAPPAHVLRRPAVEPDLRLRALGLDKLDRL